MSRDSGCRLRFTACWQCGGPATEVLNLSTGWERPICEACLIEMDLTTEAESRARQITDLRALLASLS